MPFTFAPAVDRTLPITYREAIIQLGTVPNCAKAKRLRLLTAALAAGLVASACSGSFSTGGLALQRAAQPAAVSATITNPTGASSATDIPSSMVSPSATPSAGQWRKVWADDFSGPTGSPPDPARWTSDTGGSGNGNHELQYNTNLTRNASLDGQGHLGITARSRAFGLGCWYGLCSHTSARLQTSRSFTAQYGRIEARIKIPAGAGLWPAFWMLGADIATQPWPANGEIDVMENVGSPRVVHGSLHGPGYSGRQSLSGSYTLPDGVAFAADFHTFGVDWSSTSITFSVDGHPYETQTPATTGGNPWVFDHSFFLLLDLAVGGDWPGSPPLDTAFPATMLVDYVATYKWSTQP